MPETELVEQATNAALSVGVLAIAGILALGVHLLAVRAIFRLGRSDRFAQEATARAKWPARTTSVLVGLLGGMLFTELPDGVTEGLTHLLLVLAILAGTVTLMRLAVAVEVSILSGLDMEAEDNSWARGRTTRAILLRRISSALILMVGFGSVLLTFETARTVGTSLLASAGILGLVVGVAAQSTLANIVAGIQIAVAEPIRIDDVVVVEGHWGNIEQLSLTYVVVRTWDRRRIVLPTSWFVSTPFENWSMYGAQIIGDVVWQLDHRVPMGAMREEFHRQVEEHPLWDGDVAVLQVIEVTGPTVKVRGLVSSQNSHNAWDLRCAVREGILVWLAEHHPHALPTTRLLEAAPDPSTLRPSSPPPAPMRSPGPDDVPNPDPSRTGEWPVIDR
ncbi:mechanosensitive ion channel family protein [Euzebya rosea]|uniref:mechanosensitive ion channel family protein n=1 Tax=Euzebya rosea TaxID=2052804 RepID=UPI000D3E0B71|nr:mechanosensitive ion channel domain-containing protein [Euzebya rosea]